MEDTIFTKIIKREIPADILLEDENVLAFLDIQPANKGHALIIPKIPYRNIFDADPIILEYMIRAAQKIAIALKKGIGAEGVNIVMNNEPSAGQVVFHAHMHVIPRFDDDNIFTPPPIKKYVEGESQEIARKIQEAL